MTSKGKGQIFFGGGFDGTVVERAEPFVLLGCIINWRGDSKWAAEPFLLRGDLPGGVVFAVSFVAASLLLLKRRGV